MINERVFVVVVLAGCGRLEFTPLADSPVGPGIRGLVAWYPMDDLVDGQVMDASGYDNHGTCAPCPAVTPSPRGSAYQFDRSQQIVVASSPSLTTANGLTVSYWFWLDAVALSCMVNKGFGTGTQNTWQVCLTNQAHLFVETSGIPARLMSAPGIIELQRWYHVALRWDASTPASGSLALDGVEVDSGELALSFDDQPLRLGADTDNAATVAGLKGLLDEVRIYDRVLDDAEILELAAM